ncbi:MAG: PepSY-like domain-containing protein [Chitinophagales bacterium]
MKKYIFILISILTTGFFTACQQDEILSEEATLTAEVYEASKTGDDVADTDLPEAITAYVAANYPESTIEGAKATDKGYGVKLDTGEFLVFDLEGNFVGEHTGNGHGGHGKPNGHGKPDGHGKPNVTEIDPSELPTAVTDYITANYPDATIEGAGQSDKGFGVKLDDGTLVIFDTDGNFIKEGDGHGKPNVTEIDPSELPTVITDYITANYPDATIEGAGQGDKGFGVKLDNGTFVIFDTDGNFIKEGNGHGKPDGDVHNHGTEIDPSELPTVITDYIIANYPDATIESARQGDKGFGVKLDSGVIVIFDADGNFVTEREGHGG